MQQSWHEADYGKVGNISRFKGHTSVSSELAEYVWLDVEMTGVG